jgi:hypothetical protein
MTPETFQCSKRDITPPDDGPLWDEQLSAVNRADSDAIPLTVRRRAPVETEGPCRHKGEAGELESLGVRERCKA